MLEIWHNGVDIVLKSSLNLYYGGDLFLLTFSLSLNAMKFQKCFVKSQEYYENLEQLLQRRFFISFNFVYCLKIVFLFFLIMHNGNS